MNEILIKKQNSDLKPQFDFYEKVFNDKPKEKKLYKDFEDLEVSFKNDMYGIILNNVDKMKAGKWYGIEDNEKIEKVKELMRAGFLPDISFNDDFSKIKRQNTDFHLKH